MEVFKMDIRLKNKLLKYIEIGILTLYLFVLFSGIMYKAYNLNRAIDLNVLYSLSFYCEKIILVLALIKAYACFSDNKKAYTIALIMLSFVLALKLFGLCDYVSLATMIFAMVGIDSSRIARIYVPIVSVSLFIVAIISQFGVIESESSDTDRLIQHIQGLGFGNHNTLANAFFFVLMLSVYLFKNSRYRYILLILVEVINTIIWAITGSNTPMILGILFGLTIAINWIFETKLDKYNHIQQKLYRMFIFSPLFSLIFTVCGMFWFGVYQYDKGPWSLMDRFGIAYRAFERLGLKVPMKTLPLDDRYNDIKFNWLWGIEKGHLDFYGFDIEYIHILIMYGLIVLIPFIACQIYFLRRCYYQMEYELLIIAAFTIFRGNFECSVVTIDFVETVVMLFIFANFSKSGGTMSQKLKMSANREYKLEK